MRLYAQIAPTFWTRGSGRKLRGNPDAQVLALYFMTAPSSNLVGLYYLPLITICHETGLAEARIRELVALPAFAEIARYDFDAEVVWLPECARYQIGEVMGEKDKRRPAVEREIGVFDGHPFAAEFRDRYGSGFGLRMVTRTKGETQTQDTPSEGLPSAGKPPSPDPVCSPDPVSDSGPDPDAREDYPPSGPSLEARATLWVENPQKACLVEPQPWTWREFVEVVACAQRAFPGFTIRVRNAGHPAVQAFLARAAEGLTVADLCLALEGAALTENIADNAELQTFQTIFRDAGQIDKFARVARASADKPKSKVVITAADRAALFTPKAAS